MDPTRTVHWKPCCLVYIRAAALLMHGGFSFSIGTSSCARSESADFPIRPYSLASARRGGVWELRHHADCRRLHMEWEPRSSAAIRWRPICSLAAAEGREGSGTF